MIKIPVWLESLSKIISNKFVFFNCVSNIFIRIYLKYTSSLEMDTIFVNFKEYFAYDIVRLITRNYDHCDWNIGNVRRIKVGNISTELNRIPFNDQMTFEACVRFCNKRTYRLKVSKWEREREREFTCYTILSCGTHVFQHMRFNQIFYHFRNNDSVSSQVPFSLTKPPSFSIVYTIISFPLRNLLRLARLMEVRRRK